MQNWRGGLGGGMRRASMGVRGEREKQCGTQMQPDTPVACCHGRAPVLDFELPTPKPFKMPYVSNSTDP